MDVFHLREAIINDYTDYVSSFIEIADERIRETVKKEFSEGLLWPSPLLQLNPAFEPGGSVDDLVSDGTLHQLCRKIFRVDKSKSDTQGKPMHLYKHQADAIKAARTGNNYVLTTGTGSGKSLSYIIPIVDHILKNGSGKGIKAIIVYPMNALANSQMLELEKFLGYGSERFPVTYRRYTGQESDASRKKIAENPPDIILTNYVMLELILTRPYEKPLVDASSGLKFLVFDELHTYRGRQGADVGMLIRRLRNKVTPVGVGSGVQCIGTSATLAGPGTFEEQRREVAGIAERIFGVEVKPENVIVETLVPETRNEISASLDDARFVQMLRNDVANPCESADYESFIQRPLSIWIERTIGIELNSEGHLIRCKPRPLEGRGSIVESLAQTTGLSEETCLQAIQKTLLGGYKIRKPNGRPIFAFKLHQFLSKGDTVYASIESPSRRSITLHGQQFAPGREDDQVALYPLLFCRECGKEYYSVWKVKDGGGGRLIPRAVSMGEEEVGEKGYVFVPEGKCWLSDESDLTKILPEDWIEEKKGRLQVKRSKKKCLPTRIYVQKNGTFSEGSADGKSESLASWYFTEPFQLCCECLVSYEPRTGEFSKLATLGSEGRSTATSILSMSTVTHLREEKDLAEQARKFLCFTDNRQDASLQSGHFNDFIEVGLIRSALFNALEKAGPSGLEHNELADEVFQALGLAFPEGVYPASRYSKFPDAQSSRAHKIRSSFLNALSYRIYSDLQRGWRIVAPNLEQCGLLRFEYISLAEVCADESLWSGCGHLANLEPKIRQKFAETLLNLMRRSLAIDVNYLSRDKEDWLKKQCLDLVAPWAIEENERLRFSGRLYLAGKAENNRENIYVTPASKYGKWVKKELGLPLGKDDVMDVIRTIVDVLAQKGILSESSSRGSKSYQIAASAMVWKAGDGSAPVYDQFRVHYAEGRGGHANAFFVRLYRNAARADVNLFSREHTAQISSGEREAREQDFREAKLPVLYCSPTMELGVDISQLNAVGMRNVPPTPANYAQRSGRAGRSGQPALVITYCARGSSHDQHFFRFPEEMVAGSVTTPRIDLANEDLVRAHVHAVWISEAGLDLKHSPSELVDINGTTPSLKLLESVEGHLHDVRTRNAAIHRAGEILESIKGDLDGCSWYNRHWLREVMDDIPKRFEEACERWRCLYKAAIQQRETQQAISSDASRPRQDRDAAERLRKEAVAQINLLLSQDRTSQSDFYSYRYFASEGFLPGYNFPRLPLSAFIPARRTGEDEDYISRPRFLAISEFGPGSIIYHEGSRYQISRVVMNLQEDSTLATASLKQCKKCGYVYVLEGGVKPDVCEMCGSKGGDCFFEMTDMFRMRNVVTKHRDRITSDEEERQRTGYKIRTGFRFVEHGGMPSHRDANIVSEHGDALFTLKYGQGADLWRINMGWANSPETRAPGFVLNTEKGIWVSEGVYGGADDALDDPDGVSNTQRVIPFVQDRKNCLLVTPSAELDSKVMHSLQAAFKQAIQQIYQLESFELSAETLPADGKPYSMLFVESAEGGAGVLRRLIDSPDAFREIARTALEICHFNPDTGEDLHRAPHATEDCVHACYDCLMNYENQRVHGLLSRHCVKQPLLDLAKAVFSVSLLPTQDSRTSHFEELCARCGSELEKKWLKYVFDNGYTLPTEAQRRVDACRTVPDFFYAPNVAVYIDGPVHDYADRAARDARQQDCLEDRGYLVLRFADWEQWSVTLNQHPDIFGGKQ